MSKTLFNRNTFQSKNVQNSDSVSSLKVTSFKATNAVIQNLTNTELQTATTNIAINSNFIVSNAENIAVNNGNIATNATNIATNASNIATNTSAISTNTSAISTNATNIATNASNIATNTSAISTNTSAISTNATNIATNASNIATNTSAISTNTSAIATNTSAISTNTSAIATKQDIITTGSLSITDTNGLQTALDAKQDIIGSGTTLQIEVDSNEVSAILATSAGSANFGLITGSVLNTELSSKQDNISGGDGITLSGTTLSVSQVLPNDHRVNGGFLVDNNSSSMSIIGIPAGFGVRSSGDSLDFSVVGGNTDVNGILNVIGADANFGVDINVTGDANITTDINVTGNANITTDLIVSGKISGTTVFEDFRTESGVSTANDFHITTKNNIISDGTKDELILTPSTGSGATSKDGKLHLGGFIDSTTSTYTQTVSNHHYAARHHFYLDHMELYQMARAYLNLINQTNDTSIENRLGDSNSDLYTAFVKCIRMGWTGNSSTIGEGRGHYVGLQNRGSGESNSSFIAFAKDGGASTNPDIGVAINPDGGDIYMAGEIRGYGRRGGRNLCFLFFNENEALGGSAGDGNYGGDDGDGARLTFNGNGKRIGDSFFTIGTGASSGIVTLNKKGTYKITVNATVENAGINDRACFGLYVSENDANDATALFHTTLGAGRFGITYTRDNNFGVAGNIAFSFYDTYDVGDNLRLKTKLGQGSDNRTYNDTTDDLNIDVFAKMEIEFIKGGTYNNDIGILQDN